MPATSPAGARRRALGLPKDAKEARALEKLAERNEDVSRAAVVARILEKQADTYRLGAAHLVAIVPATIANIARIATGKKGKASDQVSAGKLVLELARFTQAAGSPAAIGGANLAEMPLDQLETLLAGTLDHVRQLRAVPGSAHAVDDAKDVVPTLGTIDASGPA